MKKITTIILAVAYILFGYEAHSAYWRIAFLGWGGFGDVSLEFTEFGSIVAGIVIFFFPIAALVLFISRMIYDYVKRKLEYDWWKEVLLCVFGFALGIGLVWVLAEVRYTSWLMGVIGQLILEADLMRYPIP